MNRRSSRAPVCCAEPRQNEHAMALRSPRRMHCGASNRAARPAAEDTPRAHALPSSDSLSAPATPLPLSTLTQPSLPVNGKAPHGLGREMKASDRKQPYALSGHSEYVMQAMRDFFKVRDANALIEVFRHHDTNHSGTLEYDEFRRALSQINLELTEKDCKTLFHIADTDGSGKLEFSEFFNNFRKDGYEHAVKTRRQPFFWSSARPRELLPHNERLNLEAEIFGKPSSQRTRDELLEMIQSKVDCASNVRETFARFDFDGDGRMSAKEFVKVIRALQVDVTVSQAEQVISAINAFSGSEMRTHITFAAFARAFDHNAPVLGSDVKDMADTTNVEPNNQTSPAISVAENDAVKSHLNDGKVGLGASPTARPLINPLHVTSSYQGVAKLPAVDPTARPLMSILGPNDGAAAAHPAFRSPVSSPRWVSSPRRNQELQSMGDRTWTAESCSAPEGPKPVDRITIMARMSPRAKALENTMPQTAFKERRPSPAAEVAMASVPQQAQRLDMLSEWRGYDGMGGVNTHLGEHGFMALGRSIDWNKYIPKRELPAAALFRPPRAEPVEWLPPLTVAGYARGVAAPDVPDFLADDPALVASSAAVKAVELSRRFTGAVGVQKVTPRRPELSPGWTTPRASLRDVDAFQKTMDVRECLIPQPGSPAFARDPERHKRAEPELLVEQKHKREQAPSIRKAKEDRAMKRQQQLDELVAERDDAVTRHGISLKVDKEMVNRRVAELQLVTDSRLGLDQGLRKVLLEPPPVPEWEKPAIPSLVSHVRAFVTRTNHHCAHNLITCVAILVATAVADDQRATSRSACPSAL